MAWGGGNVPPGLLNAPDGWNAEQIRQFQEWFDSVLAGNTGGRTRLLWGPAGTSYQPFKEAPYKDEFDEWLARIVCYAFSLPPTPFIRQMNRATADTAQQAALAEGLAPLMGWVKRLCDHVIEDRMGHADLEFVWVEERPADPAEQAKVLETYVTTGIYTIEEARAILGLDPLRGGTASPAAAASSQLPPGGLGAGVARLAAATLRKYSPDEPRIPAGDPAVGEWTGGSGDGSFDVAASGDIPCQGGYCESGATFGTAAMYHIFGKNVCRDCAVKMMGSGGLPGSVQSRELERYLIRDR